MFTPMKKTPLYLALILGFYLQAQQQVTLQFPPYLTPGSTGPAIGELLTDTLWNTGKEPVEFYFQFTGKIAGTSPFKKQLLKDNAGHAAWLQAQSTATSADERRLQYVLAEARLQKTLHAHGPLICEPEHVNDTAAGYNVLQTTTGSLLSTKFKQGKMYCTQVLTNVTALAATDTACRAQYFRIVSLPNLHLIEVQYKNNWVAVDPNAGTFALVFKNKKGGYYSVADLLADTSLIYPDYPQLDAQGQIRYRIFAGDTSRYRRLFDKRAVITKAFEPLETLPVTGSFILPPGGALVFSYNNGISIDTSTADGKQYFTRLFNLQKRCGPQSVQYCDSFLTLIAKKEGVTLNQAKDAVYDGKIVFYNGAQNFSPFFMDGTGAFPYHPTLQLLVPAHSQPLALGRDIKAPLFVLDSAFSLWNNKAIPNLKATDIYCLESGQIKPMEIPLTITAAYNPNTINWLGGLTLLQQGNVNCLKITRRTPRLKGQKNEQFKAGVSTIQPVIVNNK